MKIIGEPIDVLVSNLRPTPWRKGTVTLAKVKRAKKAISDEGFTAILKGRYQSDGITVELAGGNNRLRALIELGSPKAIPVQIYDCTAAEFYHMYLKDNSAVDNQTTSWALNAVQNAPEIIGHEYTDRKTSQSQMDFDLGASMGLPEGKIRTLREMNAAIANKTLMPEIADIFDPNMAFYLWNKMKNLGVERIPFSHQRKALPLAEKHNKRGMDKLFEGWEKQVTPIKPPKSPRSLEAVVNTALRALSEVAEVSEELTPEMQEKLVASVQFLGSLDIPVVPTEEIEIVEA